MSFRSDISKLIFHHLIKEGYESSAKNLVHECPYLVELKPVQPPYKLPRLMGASLVNLIENYFETKEKIIEQLELLESVVFREQDDLLNLAKILVENLKFKTPSTFQCQKETSDASFNTELVSKTPEICDASVKTESATPETCDASVNTESISTPQTNDSSCNTDCVSNKPGTCDASVNTDVFNQEKNDPNQLPVENSKVPKETQDTNEIPHVTDSPEDVPHQLLSPKSPASLLTTLVSKHGFERSMNMNTAWVHNHDLQGDSTHCPEQLEVPANTIDFSLVYDRLLEDRDLQEKIAENINKNKVILPNQGSSKRGSLASSQDLLDTVIKAIIAETQIDPAFDDFLKDCIGSPDSTPQDYWESTVSDNNRENQENDLIPDNLGAATIVKPSNIPSSLFTVQNPDLLENSSVISGLNGLAFLTFSGQTTLVPTIISPMPLNAVPSVGERRKKKNPIVRTPVAIAPKPALTITIPAPDGNYQFTNTAGESEFFQQRVEGQQQLLGCNIETITVETSTGPSVTKPMKITNRPLTKSKRRKVAITGNRVIQASPNPHSSENLITSGLAALVKIAQEYGSSISMDIQDQEAVLEKELSKSPVVIFNPHISNSTNFVSTPISTRSLSHVHQLNSGVSSCGLSNNPASISPIVHPKRSKIPRVLALRNAVDVPPDGEILETPKGKTKRRRKSSPAPGSDDMAMASVESLQQMAPEKGINERIAPESNLSHLGMNIITLEDPVIQKPLPVLATPQKEITKNVAVVNSLNSFGPWAGEIPQTPQIRLDLTSTASPFQVLLTKGFRFLSAAESPHLPLPATPRIFEVNASSVETPYTGVYQFPSVLSTPRLEALHQEIMENPVKSLNIAVVSPTQVALDHPTPYFAPSGEEAQGPANQNATPEHVPETEKSERRRRSSTAKDPLQLEESNGAIDAVETAARQPITPYKDDQTLENDLIGECQRLQNDPSMELRSQQLVNLFGEDSTNRSEITKSAPSVPENAPAVAMSRSTPIITKQNTRKPKRTTSRKSDPGNESVNSACARAQIYPLSPQAHRRKSQRLSNNSKPSSPREDEDLIQEVLALSRLNTSVSSFQSINRKRRSHSTSSVKIGLTDEVSSEKRSKRKRK